MSLDTDEGVNVSKIMFVPVSKRFLRKNTCRVDEYANRVPELSVRTIHLYGSSPARGVPFLSQDAEIHLVS